MCEARASMDFESRVAWTALRERLYRLPTLKRLQDLREAAPSTSQGRKAFVAETAEGGSAFAILTDFRSSSVTSRAPRGRHGVCLEMRCHALAGCPVEEPTDENRLFGDRRKR